MNNIIEFKALRRKESDIHQYIHCAECFNELRDGESPREYQVLEIGWTEKGLQIWCRRHIKNVLHLDFTGQKLKALPGMKGCE